MSKFPKDASPRKKLRVVNIHHILTSEGDLIVAGTPGTLLNWDEENPRFVVVRWDAYMFTDTVEEEHGNTHEGLLWRTEPENLRYIPDVHETQLGGTFL